MRLRALLGLVLVLGVALALTTIGCGSGDGTSGGGPIVVNGVVLSETGAPYAGLTIVIGGANTTTDTNGAFSLSSITPPYTVAVLTPGPLPRVYVFVGLTRADPTLEGRLGSFTGMQANATANITCSGGAGYPEPMNVRTRVYADSNQSLSGQIGGTANSTTGVLSMGQSWPVPPATLAASYRAVQYQFDPGTMLPLNFFGYGEIDTAITPGANARNLAMQAINAATLGGAATLPGGFTLADISVNLRHGPKRADSQLINDNSPMTPFSYLVPNTNAISLDVTVRAFSPSGLIESKRQGVAPGTTGIPFTFQTQANLIAPPNNTMGVSYGTEFSADATTNRLYLFEIMPDMPTDGPQFIIVTHSPTAQIPNLNAFGAGLPSNILYRWSVQTIAPFADIDAATSSMGIRHANTESFRAGAGSREFNTAP